MEKAELRSRMARQQQVRRGNGFRFHPKVADARWFEVGKAFIIRRIMLHLKACTTDV